VNFFGEVGVLFACYDSSPVSKSDDDLIMLDESVPSVRQQMLKEQLGDLYQQPVRANAFRGSRQGAAGVVTLLQQQGSSTSASKPTSWLASAACATVASW